MLIFGARTRRRPLGPLVPLKCSSCHNTTLYDHVVVRKWFTLFFLPVFPTGGAKHFMVCPTCGKMLVFKPEHVPLLLPQRETTAAWKRGELTDDEYDASVQAFMTALRGGAASGPDAWAVPA